MAHASELKDDFQDAYQIASEGWANAWPEMSIDMEFALLAQHTAEEWEKATLQGRKLLTFDKTQRQLNLISGYEERNRHILKIAPQGLEDDPPSTQHTKIIMQQLGAGQGFTGYDLMSKAFKWGCLASGSNLVEIFRDRNNNLKLGRRGFNSFLLDPLLNNPDLSDCSYILTGQWVHEDRVKLIIPTEADKIDNLNTISSFPRWPFLGQPLCRKESHTRLYEEYWRRDTSFVETVVDRQTGEEFPFERIRDAFGDAKAARDWLRDRKTPNGGPAATVFSKPINKILLSVFVDDELVFDGENPLGLDDYNFVWFHGDWVPEEPRDELKLQGFIRGLRDPQNAYSRKMNQAFDIIESQIQSGKIVRDKYLKNYEDIYKAGQGIHLHVVDETPANIQLQDIVANVVSVDIKPGLFQLMEGIEKALIEAKGLNEEILGSDDKDIPGILHKFRTGAALTGQQGIFSGYRSSKRQVGIKLVRANQRILEPHQVFRMINEMPVPGFYEIDFTQYDCTPTEGLLTDTQRQLSYMEIKQIRKEFPDAAQFIPVSWLLKMAPIQASAELIKLIERGEQQASQQSQKQLQGEERINSLIEAQTAAQAARAREDISDVHENRANIALKNAQTVAQIAKLQGENQRAPGAQQVETVLAIMDRMLEAQKLIENRKTVERTQK
ncbi:hypothetical protein LCGC14_0358130 [marine sediment metagenome]|uniref:Uncharacterized protein n=1 Tax=marine sediment metagenome TaxID=412755 RepID=A0A0F9TRV2_9ZZZZ